MLTLELPEWFFGSSFDAGIFNYLFFVGIQRSWLSEKQVYVPASVSELPHVTAFVGLARFLTHPRALQGSVKAVLSPTLQENGQCSSHSSFLFWMKQE